MGGPEVVDSQKKELAASSHEKRASRDKKGVERTPGGAGCCLLFRDVVVRGCENSPEVKPHEQEGERKAKEQGVVEKQKGQEKPSEKNGGLSGKTFDILLLEKKGQGEKEKKKKERGAKNRSGSCLNPGSAGSRREKGNQGQKKFGQRKRDVAQNPESLAFVVEKTEDGSFEGAGEQGRPGHNQSESPREQKEWAQWHAVRGRVWVKRSKKSFCWPADKKGREVWAS